VTAMALFITSFVAMEAVSYAAHRWVMHGAGMVWHRSHHTPTGGRWELNDLFPVCFSMVGVSLFAIAALGWVPSLWWVGAGVTAYGAAYLFVHEVYIHRRTPLRVPAWSYLEWVRNAHRDHHRRGAEPYGMLLPLVRDRSGSGTQRRDPLERSVRADEQAGSTPD
jgi:beta-carotene 3-hydroxylase